MEAIWERYLRWMSEQELYQYGVQDQEEQQWCQIGVSQLDDQKQEAYKDPAQKLDWQSEDRGD